MFWQINCKLPKVQQYVLVNESIVDNVTGDVSWNVFNRSVIVTPTETCEYSECFCRQLSIYCILGNNYVFLLLEGEILLRKEKSFEFN